MGWDKGLSGGDGHLSSQGWGWEDLLLSPRISLWKSPRLGWDPSPRVPSQAPPTTTTCTLSGSKEDQALDVMTFFYEYHVTSASLKLAV